MNKIYYIKVVYKGVHISWTCYRHELDPHKILLNYNITLAFINIDSLNFFFFIFHVRKDGHVMSISKYTFLFAYDMYGVLTFAE